MLTPIFCPFPFPCLVPHWPFVTRRHDLPTSTVLPVLLLLHTPSSTSLLSTIHPSTIDTTALFRCARRVCWLSHIVLAQKICHTPVFAPGCPNAQRHLRRSLLLGRNPHSLLSINGSNSQLKRDFFQYRVSPPLPLPPAAAVTPLCFPLGPTPSSLRVTPNPLSQPELHPNLPSNCIQHTSSPISSCFPLFNLFPRFHYFLLYFLLWHYSPL